MVNPFDDEIIVYNDLPCLTFFNTPSNPLGTVESFKIGNVSVGDGWNPNRVLMTADAMVPPQTAW